MPQNHPSFQSFVILPSLICRVACAVVLDQSKCRSVIRLSHALHILLGQPSWCGLFCVYKRASVCLQEGAVSVVIFPFRLFRPSLLAVIARILIL